MAKPQPLPGVLCALICLSISVPGSLLAAGPPPTTDPAARAEQNDLVPIRFEIACDPDRLPPGADRLDTFLLPMRVAAPERFWHGKLETAPLRVRVRPETPKTRRLLLPTRVHLGGDHVLRCAKEDVEAVDVPVRNGCFLGTRVSIRPASSPIFSFPILSHPSQPRRLGQRGERGKAGAGPATPGLRYILSPLRG